MADTNTSPGTPDTSTLVTTNQEPRFSWPHMYLGAIGFAVSLYAFRLHSVIKAGGDSGCGFTDSINCDRVLASEYGTLFGLPLGIYGMAYFVVVILSSVTTNPQTTYRQETLQRLIVTAAGLLGTLALSYISYIVLRAACPVCIATHATIIACFALALWQYVDVRRRQLDENPPSQLSEAS